MLRQVILAGAAVAALTLSPGQASAITVTFDFTLLGLNDVSLGGPSVVQGGVTANGFALIDPGINDYQDALLWLRNETNDHGLGVCSELSTVCDNPSNGDIDELDNADIAELIRLAQSGGTWESIWVSSLDVNGTGNSEEGRLYWSTIADPDLVITALNMNYFTYKYGDFGTAVEGNILSLAAATAANFDKTAPYVFFRPGPASVAGDNNDHLVWKGTREVPEPATLGLLGAGLLGVGMMLRRRRAS